MKIKTKIIAGFVLVFFSTVLTAQDSMPLTKTADIINYIVCSLFNIIASVAGGIGALIIAFSGLRWVMSQDDPGTRKQATETMKHAIVGLIIILTATGIVTRVTTGTFSFGTCKPTGEIVPATPGGGGGGGETDQCKDVTTGWCYQQCTDTGQYAGARCCKDQGSNNGCGDKGNPLDSADDECNTLHAGYGECCCTGAVQPITSVSGHVKRPDGSGLVGADVAIVNAGGVGYCPGGDPKQTNDQAEYSFTGLNIYGSQCSVRASKSDTHFKDNAKSLSGKSGAVTGFDITLSKDCNTGDSGACYGGSGGRCYHAPSGTASRESKCQEIGSDWHYASDGDPSCSGDTPICCCQS